MTEDTAPAWRVRAVRRLTMTLPGLGLTRQQADVERMLAAKRSLERWVPRFDRAFRLKLPEVELRVESLAHRAKPGYRVLGTHRGGDTRSVITLSSDHVRRDERWEVLDTLLHELVHADVSVSGTDEEDHGPAFRALALACGLKIDEDGYGGCMPGGLSSGCS
jgi:SprT-like family